MKEEYTALYRKYRPQTFDEVVGQAHIVDVLEKTVSGGRIAHAYLFAGGRGTGKTTVARILARAIGTKEKDLYEMDAASNRKIDDFRELNESVHTLPFESPYKVYIIDEVHMLTKEAFNAFLKTLEEPPQHVVFILATTEIEKLPDTIISRCQTYTFEEPTRNILSETVRTTAKKEKKKIEAGAAELIAILAEGSFRDALGIFEKVLVYSKDDTITQSEVATVTGAPRAELVLTTLEALGKGVGKEALAAIGKAAEQGVDIFTFQKLLLDRVRAVLLLRHAPEMRDTLVAQFPKEDFEHIELLAQQKENGVTASLLNALLRAYSDTPHAYIKQLPLELALIESTKD